MISAEDNQKIKLELLGLLRDTISKDSHDRMYPVDKNAKPDVKDAGDDNGDIDDEAGDEDEDEKRLRKALGC